MEIIVQFQINLFALVILAVLYMIMRAKSKVESFGKKVLKTIMAATACAIVLEPMTWIFDKKLFPGAFVLEYSTNFLLFLIGPVLGGLMLSYVDYHLFKDPSRVQKRMYYQQLSIVTLAVLLINIYHPIYFDVEPGINKYSSAAFKDVHYVVLGSQYVYMFAFVIKNRKRLLSYVTGLFLLFFALPIVGMVVQLFESRIYFSWTAIVIGILVSYTFLESATTEEDFLTKLYNRQSYEVYVNHLIEIRRPFGILLIDLNHFKEVNDKYGHREGDQVLVGFARVLKKVFQHKGLCARLGGDEFIVVVEKEIRNVVPAVTEVERKLKRQEEALLRQTRFSYGYQAYEPGMSTEELYTAADRKMYEFKRMGRQKKTLT